MRAPFTPPALPGSHRPEAGADVAALKGRGTAWALPHRFSSAQAVVEDDGWGSLDQRVDDAPPAPETQVFDEQVKSILSRVDSPDIGFDLSINPYRGCEHGCIYCYARPTHSYLNLSPGLDFETRLVAKVNAAERLRAAFSAPGYRPRSLNIGSVTDAYQPVERRLRITRQLLEVMRDFKHPFSVITKSGGIERDLDILAPMAAQQLAAAHVSITTLDPQLARILEPRAASPERRLRTIARLAEAGVAVGVSVSPVIPFINEPELERILEAARAAGATRAFSIVLRLPWEVNPLFQHWLETHFPDRAARVMARVRDMRGGADNSSQFGERMRGTGPWAALLRQRFNLACRRLGYRQDRMPLDMTRFAVPEAAGAVAGMPRRPAPRAQAPVPGSASPHQVPHPAQGCLF